MRTDFYTRTILTLIALILGVNLWRSWIQPPVVLASQEQMAGVHFAVSGTKLWAIDTKINRIFIYDSLSLRLEQVADITRLGDPLRNVPIK